VADTVKRYPVDRLLSVFRKVCDAVAFSHSRGIIHRDLKPENIMVEQRRDHPDFVKVLDFGIAKILGSDLPALTRSDVVCGTPQYMAPEQATGGKLDARSDLYAVGIILYQMATSHLPFDGATPTEVLTRQVREAPVPPRKREPSAPISERMESLILRALSKDPDLRPQSAEEFRDLLVAVRTAAARTARSTPARATRTPMTAPAAPPKLSRAKLAGAIAALAALAGLAIWWMGS